MARKSNETRARELAAKLGIELTPETLGHDHLAVEVWSRDAHLSEPNSGSHTYFASGGTWPQAWRDAFEFMQGMESCPTDCTCRN